ncbi:Uncharacterised protein [Mycobacterium tuberculosis]|nr:Uncharacterised protein [Mycobacterium tuberculosis]
MFLHRSHQDFFWNFKVFSIKTSHEGSWVFNQIQDFIQQIRINFDTYTMFCLNFLDLVNNHLLTFTWICDYKLLTKVFFIAQC